MTDYVLSFNPKTDLFRAIEGLRQRNVTSAPVLDKDGYLVGVISQWDCVRGMVHGSYFEEAGGLVDSYMAQDPMTAYAEDDIVDVAEKMISRQCHYSIPVVVDTAAGKKLSGVLSCSDILEMVYRFESGKQTA
ncbi:MAG: CBS domain-containing protein [Motiliproteus sp.]